MPEPSVDEALAEREFAYGQVVAILNEVFGAENDRQRRSLRGKLKRFQLDGLAPTSVGQGRAIPYRIDDIYDWGFALTLDNLGLDPRLVVKNMKRRAFRDLIQPKTKRGQGFPMHLESDIYLLYYPSMFLDCLDANAEPMTWLTVTENYLRSTDAMQEHLRAKKAFALSNLSNLKRDIDHAAHQLLP